MGFIVGAGLTQGSLFPLALDDLIPTDHVWRVLEAFRSDRRAPLRDLKIPDLRASPLPVAGAARKALKTKRPYRSFETVCRATLFYCVRCHRIP